MKKKLNILCSLLLVLSMLLPTAAIPTFAEEGDETQETEEYTAPDSPAITYNMNVDWHFRKAADSNVYPLTTALAGVVDANGNNFYETDYEEGSEWTTVSVPHAVNAEDSFDGLGVDAGEASLYRGFMFYRKNITIPQTEGAAKFLLEFEAFRQSVYLYVNGTLVGYYEAGVAPVGFDITDYVTPGKEALIAVATDNSASRGNDNDTKETVAGSSENGTFNNGSGYEWNTKDFNEVQGGITGNVNLYVKGSIYQTLPLYNNLKTTGNYIYGSNFDLRENSADITVEAEVRNESGEAKDITLEVNLVDKDGNLVATFEKTQNVAAATDTDSDHFVSMVPESAYVYDETTNTYTAAEETGTVDISTVDVTKIIATANVSDLKFWSDVSPNLYDVYTILKDGDDVIDVQKKTTGFRDVQYDKDKGLQINGVTTYLKGYAQRSTNEWAAIGVANDWLTDIDMQLIKESNANMIRWMHIAPNPVDIRGGDKYGIISIVPAGDKEAEASGRQWDQRLEAMRDIIIYFRNSPSAMFYEAGNNYISEKHMQQMVDLKKALDPSGGKFMGSRAATGTALSLKNAEWVGTIIHRQEAEMYADMETQDNYVPMIETEYHRNESPRRVWDDYTGPYYDYVNKWLGSSGSKTDGYDIWDQTQEDFSLTMFESADNYSHYWNNRVGGSGKNYYSGAAMMVWSDSNMHVRNCGVENCRTSGRVDPVRIKKESFYAIQAAQSTEPKIHILGHWNYDSYIEGDTENGNYWYYEPVWNGTCWEISSTKLQRDPTNKTVYVIGSADIAKVELYVNGELVGTDSTPTDNFIYSFDGIDVTQSGEVSAKAYNEREELVTEDSIKTAGTPATIKLEAVTGPDGLIADGSDLAYIDVSVVDADGNVCPTDERKITFTVSDETKATFMGGYNSGYYGNYDNASYNDAGGRIVNHQNYVYAECGVNRVFVQSTRESGDFTITATAEGMQPVTITLSSSELELEGGLTTQLQQSYEQGEVPDPPTTETAPELKSLGAEFTADFTDGTGNVKTVDENEKDYYTVNVNGEEVTFTDKAYKPDSSTGVVGEINTILDKLKAAGADFTYTYNTEGDLPSYNGFDGSLPYIRIVQGENTIDIANGSTTVFVNGERNLTNFGMGLNSSQTAIIGELSTVIGSIDGVEIVTNEGGKIVDINVNGYESFPAAITYVSGAVTVSAVRAINNANLIFASYNTKGVLQDVQTQQISVSAGSQSSAVSLPDGMTVSANPDDDYVKVMLWTADMSKVKPLAPAIICDAENDEELLGTLVSLYSDNKVDEIYDNDTLSSNINCDTAVDNMTLSTDKSPDGTAYLTNTDYANNGKGVCFQSDGLGENSKADIMWEADVRFDADGGGITPYDQGDSKLGTCVRRHGTKLAVQTGSSSYSDYCDIDESAWYHIVLIGRFSSSDAKTDMIVYKYDGSEKTLVGTYESVNQRNLSANSNKGASHWNVHNGTSVDNLKITILGADTLNVTSDANEIKAGNVMQMDYSATRQGEYITKPTVTWSVYNEDNTAALSDDSGITINENGILNVGLTASSQTVNVRATAQIKDYIEIYASKAITIKAVDASTVKFDTLTLTADKDYVSATEPLQISVSASKNGETVTLSDSDLIWYATDSTDMMSLGDDLKWIKIENGKVTVDEKAISQDITIRAADPDDIVRGTYSVHIKSSDALEGNEEGSIDKLLTADNCESAISTATFTTSIDGTHAYTATAGYQTAAITETTSDIVIEMDIRFDQEGAGFQPAKSGKVNTCVIYHNGKFAIQTGGSSYTSYCDIDSETWYHITLIRKQDAYAHIVLEKYNDEGERETVGTYKDVNQRNDEATAFVNINAGTTYDNIRVLTPVPTKITVDTDVDSAFAGNTIQATSALYWNDLEMKGADSTTFEYKIYDSEDKYPIDNDLITVDSSGLITIDAMADEQDCYIRAISKTGGTYASKKFTVSSSDIITINTLGVNEDCTRLVKLYADKNFYYANEITFVVEVFDKDGNVVSLNTKQLYGESLKIGSNTINLGFDLPKGFDNAKDTIKIYAVTKVSADEASEADTTITTSAATDGITISNIPDFDSTVLVMALKSDADETDVSQEDILYFDQMKSSEITGNTITIPCSESAIIKLSGNISGTLTVKKTVYTAKQ